MGGGNHQAFFFYNVILFVWESRLRDWIFPPLFFLTELIPNKMIILLYLNREDSFVCLACSKWLSELKKKKKTWFFFLKIRLLHRADLKHRHWNSQTSPNLTSTYCQSGCFCALRSESLFNSEVYNNKTFLMKWHKNWHKKEGN